MSASSARRERTAKDVVAAFRQGSVAALARALSWIEDGDPRGACVLGDVFASAGRCRVTGITGSPGAGKSTLVDQLARRLVKAGRKTAIVAVDPSSAFSGGALLGDRIRMQDSAEQGVFIRSMATRGQLGGLAGATADAVDLLDAFGFDDVIVETVGVGQDEIDVVQVAHVNALVLVPFMGDDIQAIKAGIMEIADVYVVNKADREGADRMESHVRALLQLTEGEPKDVPILRTVATRGDGVDELLACLDGLHAARRTEARAAWRQERIRRRLTLMLRDRLLADFLADARRAALFEAAASSVAARAQDPHRATERLVLEDTPMLDHVGVAVEDLPSALGFWRDAVGLPVEHEEDVPSEGVRVAMLPAGDARIELLEALPGPGPVRTFLDRRGPGIHHVCLQVRDIAAATARLLAAGAQLVGTAPRPGAGGKLVAFVHPRSATGVLLELSQAKVPEAEGTR